jgi:hypothetical protein
MSPATTLVRISLSARRHRKGQRSYGDPAKQPLPGGGTVRVYLPPERPDSHWKCDTKLVWRVVESEVVRLAGGPAPCPVYVCEHQVELD